MTGSITKTKVNKAAIELRNHFQKDHGFGLINSAISGGKGPGVASAAMAVTSPAGAA